MKHFSKFGLTLVVLYLLTAASLFIYAFTCHGDLCGIVAIIPFLPWLLFLRMLFDGLFGFYPHDLLVFVISGVLNTIIIYFVGFAIGAVAKRLFKESRIPKS